MNVLFLCTGNSARSQMSEAFAGVLGNGEHHFQSAGTAPSAEVHPLAVRVMAERGIDISAQTPKTVAEIPVQVRHVIAVCSHAADNCPIIPGANMERWDLDDPAAAIGSLDERLAVFRQSRDEIETRVTAWLSEHEGLG